MISVIIPTRNRADLLQLALQSLQFQTLSADSFKVLVIDNGSTDNTKQVVATFQQQLCNVRYFFDPTPGLHVGRHLGMKMAKSKILVYADDDIEAFPTWLEAIAESFQDPEVVLVGGKNLPKWETQPPAWMFDMWKKNQNGNRILGYLSILDLRDEKKEINPYLVFGCNFSIRKSVLLEAGGFHPDAMPQELIKYRGDGESHISRYIFEKGYKALYQPKASVYHSVPKNRMTEDYFYKRAYNQGISDSFTQIRAFGGLSKVPSLRCIAKSRYETLMQISPNDILRTISRRAKRVIGRPRERPFDEIQGKIAQASRAGWQFHQDEVQNDPKLLEYVLKQSYLE